MPARDPVTPANANAGKPLVLTDRIADCSPMNGIGPIGTLTTQAAQPLLASRATPSDAVSDAAGSSADERTGATSAPEFSADYAMSLLAKITHAGADQALALIQSLATPVAPTR
jgi:hypothetical protein